MSEEIKSIKQWFEKAKPNPTPEDISVQIGCHYEEVCEMLESHGWANGSDVVAELNETAEWYKSKSDKRLLLDINDVQLLDALCDQIVTAIGVAHMLGMDIVGALNEVNNSNYSKFDDNGYPILNEQGKISKGPNYFPPKLEKFV